MPASALPGIPTGASVFIDANIFVYALTRRSPQCLAFLSRISLEEITGVTSLHVIGEVTHKLMLAELIETRGGRNTPRKYLEEHREAVKELTRYWASVEEVLAMNIIFLPVNEAIVRSAHLLRQQYGLLNNDSWITACMQEVGVTFMASNDEAFAAIPGFSVFKPTDL